MGVLLRSTELDRLLITHDHHFLTIAASWQLRGTEFPGIIYSHPLRVSIGQLLRDLVLIAEAGEPSEFRGLLYHLPL